VVERVRAALLQMRGPAYAELLRRLYDIDGFEPAEDREYDVVRQAMDLVGLRPR
jgi:ABC-type phosphate/phosphonate transport system substrate-binding protein